jgi:predicted esterase
VNESFAAPVDVLTVSANGGRGRIYTQFMDYSRWNPTFNGYAYNYAVALPVNYNPKKKYPLFVELHAYQEPHKYAMEAQYGWQVIQLFPSDPGPTVGARHSWWFGYAADHDYRNGGNGPVSGNIENFTEQRVMRAIDQQAGLLSVDTNRIYGAGNSMGASGLLAMAIRYGSVLTGVYANEPMTNYQSNPQFSEELVQLWGAKSRNLPVVNRGLYSSAIRDVRVGVWDWMNHQQQLVQRRGTDIAFLMTLHGKQDRIIDWQTQGKPFVQALNQAKVGFTARYEDVGHTWVGFSAAIESLFGFGYDEHFPYKYPRDLSFPGISRASGSGPLQPAGTGADAYNMNIEWATPHNRFGSGIVDKSKRYEVTLRSLSGKQTADITPRRTRQFKPVPGQQCQFKAAAVGGGESAGSGSFVVGGDGLATAVNVAILPGSGTRLRINCR